MHHNDFYQKAGWSRIHSPVDASGEPLVVGLGALVVHEGSPCLGMENTGADLMLRRGSIPDELELHPMVVERIWAWIGKAEADSALGEPLEHSSLWVLSALLLELTPAKSV